jgi:hypothetical protein
VEASVPELLQEVRKHAASFFRHPERSLPESKDLDPEFFALTASAQNEVQFT